MSRDAVEFLQRTLPHPGFSDHPPLVCASYFTLIVPKLELYITRHVAEPLGLRYSEQALLRASRQH